MKIFLLVPTPN